MEDTVNVESELFIWDILNDENPDLCHCMGIVVDYHQNVESTETPGLFWTQNGFTNLV